LNGQTAFGFTAVVGGSHCEGEGLGDVVVVPVVPVRVTVVSVQILLSLRYTVRIIGYVTTGCYNNLMGVYIITAASNSTTITSTCNTNINYFNVKGKGGVDITSQ